MRLDLPYSAIDIFAGCGGLSLGFEQAGFHIPYALEIDNWASDTYKENRKRVHLIREDICQITNSRLRNFRGIDVVIGGPPCQGFSISASNRRDPNDPRNFLYIEFVRFINETRPKVLLVENVKEILEMRLPDRRKLIDDFRERLDKIGYKTAYCLLNAADFGVPQNRIRFFMFGIRGKVPNLVKLDSYALFGKEDSIFRKPNLHRTVNEAISDLPQVFPRQHEENSILSYEKEPENDFQNQMRANSNKIFNHIPMRHTDRIIDRFKTITVDDKQAYASSKDHGCRMRGNSKLMSGKIYYQNHRRLNPELPSPTITASFYSSFIHPDQHRNLTVREAARIQSFPDNYIFYGKRTTLSKKLLSKKGVHEDLYLDQFNQVGNAVPPIMANVLAVFILNNLLT